MIPVESKKRRYALAPQEPWSATQATVSIREIAKSRGFTLAYKVHAVKRESERSLYAPDVLYVLKNGFVFKNPVPATREGYFKYEIQCQTPNSDSREICLVVIPDVKNCVIKLVTIMWVDEISTRAGTLMEAIK